MLRPTRCGCAGRFGFQKEMNALSSLQTGNAAEAEAVTSLLRSTHEIERRIQELYRWWRLWLPDVREGWSLLARWRVSDSQHQMVSKTDRSAYPQVLLHVLLQPHLAQ